MNEAIIVILTLIMVIAGFSVLARIYKKLQEEQDEIDKFIKDNEKQRGKSAVKKE